MYIPIEIISLIFSFVEKVKDVLKILMLNKETYKKVLKNHQYVFSNHTFTIYDRFKYKSARFLVSSPVDNFLRRCKIIVKKIDTTLNPHIKIRHLFKILSILKNFKYIESIILFNITDNDLKELSKYTDNFKCLKKIVINRSSLKSYDHEIFYNIEEMEFNKCECEEFPKEKIIFKKIKKFTYNYHYLTQDPNYVNILGKDLEELNILHLDWECHMFNYDKFLKKINSFKKLKKISALRIYSILYLKKNNRYKIKYIECTSCSDSDSDPEYVKDPE